MYGGSDGSDAKKHLELPAVGRGRFRPWICQFQAFSNLSQDQGSWQGQVKVPSCLAPQGPASPFEEINFASLINLSQPKTFESLFCHAFPLEDKIF